MNVFTKSMFSTIRDSLTKDEGGNRAKWKEFLKTEAGNIYTVRLVPNVSDPAKTFFHYFSHSWESFSTGQFTSVVSPNTWGERDPISEAYLSIMKHGTDGDKKKARAISRRENWLVNVYVVNDPKNPDNNGKVKILRYGKQLHKIIMDGLNGDDADEVGERMFDLTDKGCNFKIKVERQGDFPTYVSSKFAMPSDIEDMDEEAVAKVHAGIHDLDTVFTVKSYDDLKETLQLHYYCKSADDAEEEAEASETSVTQADRAFAGDSTGPEEESKPSSESDVLNDEKVQELLKGLDG
ncbi:hypothetical protein CL634_11125 [bacterium]|nr:hypothetical protein [bacterium]